MVLVWSHDMTTLSAASCGCDFGFDRPSCQNTGSAGPQSASLMRAARSL